jgi:hypothetical protein
MKKPLCNDENCYMPAVLLLKGVPYCVADYRLRNNGRI